MIAARAQARNRYFPTIKGITTWPGASATSGTHTVILPTATTGDLLVVIFSTSASTTITPSAGWTTVAQAGQPSYIGSAVFWKTATGSDVLVVTTGASSIYSSALIVRASDARMVEAQVGVITANITPDPPALTPSRGSQYSYLVAVSASTRKYISSPPSGFSTATYTIGAASLSPGTSVCTKLKSSSSENPGTCTINNSVYRVPWTIVLYNP